MKSRMKKRKVMRRILSTYMGREIAGYTIGNLDEICKASKTSKIIHRPSNLTSIYLSSDLFLPQFIEPNRWSEKFLLDQKEILIKCWKAPRNFSFPKNYTNIKNIFFLVQKLLIFLKFPIDKWRKKKTH